jgi:hypothetical protein
MVATTTSISSRPSAVILIISSRLTRGHARCAQPSNNGMTCPKDRPANSRLARQRVTGASATGLSVSFWSRGQHPRAVTLLCPAGEANVAGRIPRRPSLANQSTLARARHRCPRHDTRQSNMSSTQSPDGTLVESRPTAAQSVTRSCLTAPWSAGHRVVAPWECMATAHTVSRQRPRVRTGA